MKVKQDVKAKTSKRVKVNKKVKVEKKAKVNKKDEFIKKLEECKKNLMMHANIIPCMGLGWYSNEENIADVLQILKDMWKFNAENIKVSSIEGGNKKLYKITIF